MTERVLRSIGHPALIDDPRFRTNSDRVRNAAELDALIGGFIAQRTLAENLDYFDREEVTVGPIYDIAQIMQDRYVIEREVLADYPDAQMGRIPMHCVVPRLSVTPGAIRLPAPGLGEHNDEVLALTGLTAEAIAALKARGVVREGDD